MPRHPTDAAGFPRRTFLGALAALGATAWLPRALRAADPALGRRLLVVFNPGGWDPFAALAPMYGAPGVQMSPLTGAATAGGLAYVDSPAVSVRAYFEAWHGRTALLHGLSVPSVSHEICANLMLTGRIGADRPDWASTIGDAARDAYAVPSLVVGGPSFPGAAGVSTARVGTNGQLQRLLDGSIRQYSDDVVAPGFADPTRRLLDRYAQARASARADFSGGGADEALARAWEGSLARARALHDTEVDFNAVYDLRTQLSLAVDVIERGLSRAVSVTTGQYGSWDTHQNNDQGQIPRFDQLFAALHDTLGELQRRTDADGAPLLDSTTVVVLSEMGRTPTYNTSDGRDHWPFTSALLAGGGVAGDRVVGAYDDAGFGRSIDLRTGEPSPGGVVPHVEHLGATLLALAGVAPEGTMSDIPPITGLIA